MTLSDHDIRRIAHLARIAVSREEVQQMSVKLTGIFGLIEEMQALDTSGVEPMSHAQDVMLRLREDQVTETNQREALQAMAPQTENGLFLVPKVIE